MRSTNLLTYLLTLRSKKILMKRGRNIRHESAHWSKKKGKVKEVNLYGALLCPVSSAQI